MPIDRNVQMLVLAEEVGEAVKEWRSYSGNSRKKSGQLETWQNLCEELADVIITAQVMLLDMGEDPELWVDFKLDKIMERGGK